VQIGKDLVVLVPHEVDFPTFPLDRFRPLIGEQRYADLETVAAMMRALLRDADIWNVNSTDRGGGVAEMLQVLLGYGKGAGLDVRWLVIAGDAEFFAITKRIHNRLHGVQGDDGELGPAQLAHYRQVLADNASTLVPMVERGDIVLLHDPQTAGLGEALNAAGAHTVWRCHVGTDHVNDWTEEAWGFLRPFVEACEAWVFTRHAFVPLWLTGERVAVIPPSIDPFSPKNQELEPDEVRRILGWIGLVTPPADETRGRFIRRDGSVGHVIRQASIVAEGPPLDPAAPLVVQVSRWDRLKDMRGVMTGFASRVVGRVEADLALVGPEVTGVNDDPEGAEVLAECTAAWEALEPDVRRRVRLVTLPMDDVDENAAMVNAIQRHASVIVQKSLAEGFGLTVAEGMWKSKTVLGSAVGGIVDQIAPGTGVLLPDPEDLDAYGDTLASLLERPGDLVAMGRRARRHVIESFLGDRHLVQYAQLVRLLLKS
jgi:trehalose synthase